MITPVRASFDIQYHWDEVCNASYNVYGEAKETSRTSEYAALCINVNFHCTKTMATTRLYAREFTSNAEDATDNNVVHHEAHKTSTHTHKHAHTNAHGKTHAPHTHTLCCSMPRGAVCQPAPA